MNNQIPAKYISIQKNWARKERWWTFLHYGLGVSASLLAFAAANKGIPKLVDEGEANLLALAAGLTTTALTFFSPAARRKAYMEARNLLRIARMRYEAGEAISLNDAMEKAHEMIVK